ncbi:MAG: flagellar protein FlgN [Lachnospiraceae bacterium]|nr:flagellar protein FlgN [Lachnospiraceae bacterium]
MASLIDELISVLEQENDEYKQLIDISSKKTRIIVKNDLDTLRAITAEEQKHLGTLINLEKKREDVTSDIALVMNRKKEDMTVKSIIPILEGQKEVQSRLVTVHEEIRKTLKDFNRINEINKSLIQESLELIDFNLNFVKGMYQAPEVANYSKDASNTSPTLDIGVFDAKQ